MSPDLIELLGKIAQGGTGGVVLFILFFAVRSYQTLIKGLEEMTEQTRLLRETLRRHEEMDRKVDSNTELLNDIGKDVIRLQARIHAARG